MSDYSTIRLCILILKSLETYEYPSGSCIVLSNKDKDYSSGEWLWAVGIRDPLYLKHSISCFFNFRTITVHGNDFVI